MKNNNNKKKQLTYYSKDGYNDILNRLATTKLEHRSLVELTKVTP